MYEKRTRNPVTKPLPELTAALRDLNDAETRAREVCERRYERGEIRVTIRVSSGQDIVGNPTRPVFAEWRVHGDLGLNQVDAADLEWLLERRRAFERWCAGELKTMPPSEVER